MKKRTHCEHCGQVPGNHAKWCPARNPPSMVIPVISLIFCGLLLLAAAVGGLISLLN